MLQVRQSLKEFAEALSGGDKVVCTPKGGWKIEAASMGKMRGFFSLEEARLMTLSPILIRIMDESERMPGYEVEALIEAAKAAVRHMELFETKNIERERLKILRRLIGLQYRMEEKNAGLSKTEVQPDLLHELLPRAFAWKKAQELIEEKPLTQVEFQKLEEATRYPEFVELLLMDTELQHNFFNWVIRDGNAVAPFVEFPAMQEELVACGLNGRIGRMGGKDLQIANVDGVKQLQLKMQNKMVNILDPERVVEFEGHYKLTVHQVLDIFRKRNGKVAKLEFMKDGVINWNPYRLARWDGFTNKYTEIDVNRSKWWEQMPAFEELTLEQAQDRYGYHLDGVNWNVAAAATRGSASLDFDQTHAFLEIAVPKGGGNYAIYFFGKFASEFGATFWENFLTFSHTVHATVVMPDENVFYTQRQHTKHSFVMSESEGLHLMDEVRQDIVRAREKNFVYQIETENCAKWVHEKIASVLGEHNMPNMFCMPLLDTEPVGVAAALFNSIKMLPDFMQVFTITRLQLLIGASKKTWVVENGKKVAKSLDSHEFWNTGIIYLPAFLHKQKNLGFFQEVHAPAAGSFDKPDLMPEYVADRS